MISVWQVISLCVNARTCNDFSVVLRRVRNCLYIIIIIIIITWEVLVAIFNCCGLAEDFSSPADETAPKPEDGLDRDILENGKLFCHNFILTIKIIIFSLMYYISLMYIICI